MSEKCFAGAQVLLFLCHYGNCLFLLPLVVLEDLDVACLFQSICLLSLWRTHFYCFSRCCCYNYIPDCCEHYFLVVMLTAFFRSTANRQQHVHAHDHEPITGNGQLRWWLVATIQPNNSKRANIEGPPSNVIPPLSAVTVDISSSSSNDAIQIFFFFLLLLLPPPPLCCDVIIVCCVLWR